LSDNVTNQKVNNLFKVDGSMATLNQEE